MEIVNQKRESANKDGSAANKWKGITPEVKLYVTKKSENGNVKAKVGWDLNLHKATVQIILKKSNEYKSKLKSLQHLIVYFIIFFNVFIGV